MCVWTIQPALVAEQYELTPEASVFLSDLAQIMNTQQYQEVRLETRGHALGEGSLADQLSVAERYA